MANIQNVKSLYYYFSWAFIAITGLLLSCGRVTESYRLSNDYELMRPKMMGDYESILRVGSYMRLPIEAIGLSFHKEPFVNPAMIKEFMTWLSDNGDQIVGINPEGMQKSNRSYADVNSKMVPGSNKHPLVYYEYGDDRFTEMFGYRLIGRTSNGIYVIRCINDTAGTAIFGDLLFLELVKVSAPLLVESKKHDWNTNNFRYELRKIGQIGLGDRTSQDIKIDHNTIKISEDLGKFRELYPSGEFSVSLDGFK